MRYPLSIKTVFPRPGARVWYDDQRNVHRQIFEGDEMVNCALMGQQLTACIEPAKDSACITGGVHGRSAVR